MTLYQEPCSHQLGVSWNGPTSMLKSLIYVKCSPITMKVCKLLPPPTANQYRTELTLGCHECISGLLLLHENFPDQQTIPLRCIIEAQKLIQLANRLVLLCSPYANQSDIGGLYICQSWINLLRVSQSLPTLFPYIHDFASLNTQKLILPSYLEKSCSSLRTKFKWQVSFKISVPRYLVLHLSVCFSFLPTKVF